MKRISQGLSHNWQQFSLLVLVNAFVGGMVGMERSVFAEYADTVFNIKSKTAILSFIVAFGISKSISNYLGGRLANKVGRKNLLLLGWIAAIPVPYLLIGATTWNWVIVANVLLGISQGFTWSTTVIMKIDMVGDRHRGFALGLNEFAGYVSIGIVALITGLIAENSGITPYPFYTGIIISSLGLLITILFVQDTGKFVNVEQHTEKTQGLKNVFADTTIHNRTLSAVTQAGLVNNMNDGMIWGLLPVLLLSLNYDAADIGIITAIYPAVWGIGQLFTGKISDHYSKKRMLVAGMLVQGIAILFLPQTFQFTHIAIVSVLIGVGTAIVYPTFLSSIAEVTTPQQRPESLGTFRFWRDMGYAIGAMISGIIADLFGIGKAILLIGLITLISGVVLQIRIPRNSLS